MYELLSVKAAEWHRILVQIGIIGTEKSSIRAAKLESTWRSTGLIVHTDI